MSTYKDVKPPDHHLTSPIPPASYHSDYELINAAAELAGFKDPHEFLSQQTLTFIGRLLEIIRHDTETIRLARVIALFYQLPIAHLPQLSALIPHQYVEVFPDPVEMTEPCV